MAGASSDRSRTVFSRVGNRGCIRFPKPLRSISGIKRGHCLAAVVAEPGILHLEKVDIDPGEALPEGLLTTLQVDTCACESPSASCRDRPLPILTVGWSYVQFEDDLAVELGLEANAPIRLTARPSVITVEVNPPEGEAWDEVHPVPCPP